MNKKICAATGCGKTFDCPPSRGRPKLFCSPTCRHNSRYDRSLLPSYNDRVGRCKTCNDPFDKKRTDQIFCSTICKTDWHNAAKKKEKEILVTKKKMHDKCCHYCGTDYQAERVSSKFCATKCRTAFHSQYRFLEYVTMNQLFDSHDYMMDDLIGHIFIDCVFTECDFSNRIMTRARFIRCDFTDCNFDKSVFNGVDLIDCEFYGHSRFDGANIALTQFGDNYAILNNALPNKTSRSKLRQGFLETLKNKAEREFEI